jgi:glycine cleavage system aminomethyltransferase T
VADTVSAHVGAVTACATSDALDALVVPGRATACRIADDELLLVCRPEVADEVVREVETRLTVLDPDAIVVETTDAWATSVLEGDEARSVFALLSRLHLPDRGFVQGEVAHVPAKVLVEDGGIRILVPAALGAHLRSRIAELTSPEAAP